MMTEEIILRIAHIIGACVLLGTGAGIAFFMVMAHRTRDAGLIAHTAGIVVLADTLFTATAVIVQPITGWLLARMIGWEMSEGWFVLALCLYVFVGIFWLPVVWVQIQLRNMARASAQTGTALPPRYFKLYRFWFICGFPAFAGVIAIIWLMIARPALSI